MEVISNISGDVSFLKLEVFYKLYLFCSVIALRHWDITVYTVDPEEPYN